MARSASQGGPAAALPLSVVSAWRRWRQLRRKRRDFFLSYRPASGRLKALELYDWLVGEGNKVWMDCYEDQATVNDVVDGIRHSRAFILFLTEDVFDSSFVCREVMQAVFYRKPIILIHLPGFDFDNPRVNRKCPESVRNVVTQLAKKELSVEFNDDERAALLEHVNAHVSTFRRFLRTSTTRSHGTDGGGDGGDATTYGGSYIASSYNSEASSSRLLPGARPANFYNSRRRLTGEPQGPESDVDV